MRHTATLAAAALALVSLVACEPEHHAPAADDCGTPPASFDPEGEVVHAVGEEGCIRIERRRLEDGTFAPVRLVAHLNGFTGRIDTDTDALTYETTPRGETVVASDDVKASLSMDVCTGEWMVDVNEGEAILAVVE